MTAKQKLRPAVEGDLPLGHLSLDSRRGKIAGSPHWDRLMDMARDIAGVRGERVQVIAGWVERNATSGRWVYVIECASWCGCRKGDR